MVCSGLNAKSHWRSRIVSADEQREWGFVRDDVAALLSVRHDIDVRSALPGVVAHHTSYRDPPRTGNAAQESHRFPLRVSPFDVGQLRRLPPPCRMDPWT